MNADSKQEEETGIVEYEVTKFQLELKDRLKLEKNVVMEIVTKSELFSVVTKILRKCSNTTWNADTWKVLDVHEEMIEQSIIQPVDVEER